MTAKVIVKAILATVPATIIGKSNCLLGVYHSRFPIVFGHLLC